MSGGDDDGRGSVSLLIARMKDGDQEAFGRLHQRYWPALVNLGRSQLRGAPIRAADEEDVAQKAFLGFYETVRDQRVPELNDRHQLLALLSHIVACKAINEIKREMAKKRGGGQVRSDAILDAMVSGNDHTPLQEAILKDSYSYYLRSLPESLQPFAEMHLAGITNQEIAERRGVSERTVERKMALLRTRWQQLAGDSLNHSIDGLLGAPDSGA